MIRKAYLKFIWKVSATLTADNAGKGYDCLYDLFCDFEEALISLAIALLRILPITLATSLLM